MSSLRTWLMTIGRLSRLIALIKKEFMALLTDPSTRAILVFPVIIQSILFGYGATYNLQNIPWVLYDGDHSATSQHIVEHLNGNGFFTLVEVAPNMAAFERSLVEGRALIGVAVAPQFEARRQSNLTQPGAERPAQIELVADARNLTTANVAMGYTRAAIGDLLSTDTTLTWQERFLYNPQNLTRYSIMPSLILALTMIQVLSLSGLSVAREREEGTFDMLLMTPLTVGEIYLGKAIPAITVGVGQGLLIWAVCYFWFEIPFAGSFLTLLTVIGLFATSLVALGLAVSALSRTLQKALIGAFLIVLPSIILSGLMTPIEAMPEWMQIATYANPLRFAIEAVRRVYFEATPLSALWPLLIPTLVQCVVSTVLALVLFKRNVT